MLINRVQSLKSCIAFLRSPETPALLRAVFPASVTLVERTTSPASDKRFDQLWALLGDGIIETIWFYGYEEADTLQATLDVLPVLVRALGMGSARYLKVRTLGDEALLMSARANPHRGCRVSSFNSCTLFCRSQKTPLLPLSSDRRSWPWSSSWKNAPRE